jgi:biopolymer transport protein ExbB
MRTGTHTLCLAALALMSCVLSLSVSADTSALLATTQQAQGKQAILNQQRESEFHIQERDLDALKLALTKQKNQLQQDIDAFNAQFSANEQALSEQEQALKLESGSLGELFGVVRQVAKELQLEQEGLVSAIGSDYLSEVDSIAQAKTLPSTQQLYRLWQAFRQQISAGSTLDSVPVPYVGDDGVVVSNDVLRIGAFGLTGQQGYLRWNPEQGSASAYSVQPKFVPSPRIPNTGQLWTFDPTKGALLELLAKQPTLLERIEQGGIVGKVIVAILVLGIVIGLVQGSIVFTNRRKIHVQLQRRDQIGNNPLGRILSVYKYDKSPNVEALELRLYEAILDEQQRFEKGLSLLKLLAALSPMLGLLGTVTGMIETFQVITQYGNADPKIMAGGISMALVTTVLGLVAAMPLLFIHNVLSTQSEHIRTLLEKQGVGMVAERAEQAMEAA